jgi:hypothetical protein
VRWSDSARTSHLSFSPEWQVVPGSHLWRENQRTSPCPWFGFQPGLVRTTRFFGQPTPRLGSLDMP